MRSGRVLVLVALAAATLYIAPYLRDLFGEVILGSEQQTSYALLSRAALIGTIEALENERARSAYQAALYQAVLDDLTDLQSKVGLLPKDSYGMARIIARPPRTHYDSVLIDRGSNDGVRAGDWATSDGVLFGEVTSVSDATAVVQLYSSPGSERSVSVGEPQAIVTIRGVGGGSYEALLPEGVQTASGDFIYDEFTQLPLAIVYDRIQREGDATARIYAAHPMSVSSLTVLGLMHTIN